MRPMNIMQHLNEGENETKKCVICGKTYKGWGNDAWPVADGYCCDKCNNDKVLPARIAQMYGLKESSNSDEEAINKRIKEIKKELDYCRKRDEVCLSLDGEEQVAELEAELEELENKLDELNESDGEWDTYTVSVGFCGFIGVEEEYNISARSKQEAVCEALDNPGSEAEQDLSADVVDDHGDGTYTVTVSFAGNLGAENDYEVTAESAEEAEMLALEDAKSDLEIISVNGEEYNYGDEVESAGIVNEGMGDYLVKREEEDNKDAKSAVSYYIIGEKDFQKLLKLNGGAFDSGYLVISTVEANKLANKQGLIVNDKGIFSDK